MQKYFKLTALLGFLVLGCVQAVSAQVYVQSVYGNTVQTQTGYGVPPVAQNSQKYPELCSVLDRTFGYGDEGQDVRRLQVVLGQEGISYLNATGYFGPVTRSAVKIFQGRNGIRQTGAVGPVTLARMRALWCYGVGGNNSYDYNTNNRGPLEITIAPTTSSGNVITIGWNSKNAQSCTLNGQTVSPSGQQNFTLTGQQDFTISCTNYYAGQVSKTITVRPNQSISNLPSVSLSINPTQALVNSYATLFWNSVNTVSCNLNGQNIPLSGSQQVYVTSTQANYKVTCSDVNGYTVSSTIWANPNTNTNTNPQGQVSINITTNKAIYSVGETMTITSTLTNNSANTISYSNTSCTPNFNQTIDNNPTSYAFSDTPYVAIPQIACSPNYNLLTLAPGQSTTQTNSVVVRSYMGNGSTSNGSHTISENISVNGQTIYGTANFSVGTSGGGTQTGTLFGNPTSGNAPLTVNFSGNVTGYGYSLDFGDSSTPFTFNSNLSNSSNSLSVNTSHTYTSNGTYVAKLYSRTYPYNCGVDFSITCPGTGGGVNYSMNLVGSVTIYVGTTGTGNVSVNLTATPNSVSSGQAVTLSWTSTNATYCRLSNSPSYSSASPADGQNQTISGSTVVYPTQSTTYAIYCYNNLGQSSSANAYVAVNGNNNSTISLVSQNGNMVTVSLPSVGGTINWGDGQSTNHSTIYCITTPCLQQAQHTYSNSGTYQINYQGNILTVTVNSNNSGSVTATINANPATVASGQSVTLTWTSTNANYCNITSNNTSLLTNQAPNGSYVVYPSIGTNYQINCYNNNGQNGAGYVYVQTNGNNSSTPTATIYANNTSVISGQQVNLNWYSSNANSCVLYGNGNLLLSNQSTSGSYLVYPTASTNYQITCTNTFNNQTGTSNVYVTVNGGGGSNASITLLSNYYRNLNIQVYKPPYSTCSAGYIDWGDGSATTNYFYPSVGNGSPCQVAVTHTYASFGTFLIRAYESSAIVASLQVQVQ